MQKIEYLFKFNFRLYNVQMDGDANNIGIELRWNKKLFS